MNEDNIKPHRFSRKTAARKPREREIQRAGGKARQQQVQERKRMKDLMDDALETAVENCKGEKLTRRELAALRLATRMASGDLKAIELGLNILGETTTTAEVALEIRPPRDLTVAEVAELRREMEKEY